MNLEEIKAFLESEKAEDVTIMDLEGKTNIADYMIICTGLNKRHVAAVAEKFIMKIKENEGIKLTAEGLEVGEWVLVPYNSTLIHIFQRQIRENYKLEDLWKERIK